MAQGPAHRVPFRRRREGRTDYRKRLGLLKSKKPRLVVRVSNRNVLVQFIDFSPAGDRVLAQASSVELGSRGWSRGAAATPAAYLAGLLAGKRAASSGVSEAVLDIGRARPTPGGRLFGAMKGVVDAGVAVPHDEKAVPGEDRIKGVHLGPEVATMFESVRSKISNGGGSDSG